MLRIIFFNHRCFYLKIFIFSVFYKPAATIEALTKQGREVRERVPTVDANEKDLKVEEVASTVCILP